MDDGGCKIMKSNIEKVEGETKGQESNDSNNCCPFNTLISDIDPFSCTMAKLHKILHVREVRVVERK